METGKVKTMRHVAITVLMVLAVSTSAAQNAGPLQQDLRKQLQLRLDTVATSLDGVLGYVLVDLVSNERVAARLESQAFPTASTIKLSILYELLKQAEEGRLELNKPAPLERQQVVGGSGVLQHLSGPMLSLADHAALMIIVSDNTATNVVIDAVGMQNVTARMKGLGLADILLRRKMMDSAAARRGDENVASPASLAKSAELLWRGEGLRKESRDAALLEGVRAEAAVVELEGRPFALAAMTTYLRNDPEGERAIRGVADAAFSYFERVAQGGAYGRKSP
jgi:beta-lactamase class A